MRHIVLPQQPGVVYTQYTVAQKVSMCVSNSPGFHNIWLGQTGFVIVSLVSPISLSHIQLFHGDMAVIRVKLDWCLYGTNAFDQALFMDFQGTSPTDLCPTRHLAESLYNQHSLHFKCEVSTTDSHALSSILEIAFTVLFYVFPQPPTIVNGIRKKTQFPIEEL